MKNIAIPITSKEDFDKIDKQAQEVGMKRCGTPTPWNGEKRWFWVDSNNAYVLGFTPPTARHTILTNPEAIQQFFDEWAKENLTNDQVFVLYNETHEKEIDRSDKVDSYLRAAIKTIGAITEGAENKIKEYVEGE